MQKSLVWLSTNKIPVAKLNSALTRGNTNCADNVHLCQVSLYLQVESTRQHNDRTAHDTPTEISPTLDPMPTTEKWRQIAQNPNYEISNHGHLRTTRLHAPRGSKAQPSGHMPATLTTNGKTRRTYIHRLVAETFLGPPPTPQRNNALHRDDNPANNHVDNIYWGTRKQNSHDAVRNGRNSQAQKTHCPRGHRLEAPNLWQPALKNGARTCLACRRATTKLARHKVPTGSPQFRLEADNQYARITAT